MSGIDISEEILVRESPRLMKFLLLDRTTRKSLVWATYSYELLGKGFGSRDSITLRKITGVYADLIQPRSEKSRLEQKDRTKVRAEVFTPTWLVDKQVGMAEESLLELPFSDYIETRWLEITCGEAPYMVTRYDAVTGESIPLKERVGFLDRKLQRISREIADEPAFFDWVVKAYQASYGYEFQGDSLLLARENLLASFEDYYKEKFQQSPSIEQKEKIATILSYNVFQMDGLTKTTPYSERESSAVQLDLFEEAVATVTEAKKTKIKNWKKNKMIDFERLSSEETEMKFDVVIGNPPYQEETEGTSDKPIYNHFMDESVKIADKSILITPARFLFNAGKTPKAWNKKILADEHLKVTYYEQDSSKVFVGPEIKGGVTITYRDKNKIFGAIGTFTHFKELNTMYKKVYYSDGFETLSNYVYAPESYKLTETLHKDFPNIESRLSKGHKYDVTTNIFEKLYDVFTDTKQSENDVEIIGRLNGERVYKYIDRKYLKVPDNFENYKVVLPKANGSGAIGEKLSTPLVGTPLVGHTQTFISIGNFSSLEEAENLYKYIKTHFARVLLGVLKITQDNKKATWKYVPWQDFTKESDVPWHLSISELDQYFYTKYNFSQEEILFIETHVREMD